MKKTTITFHRLRPAEGLNRLWASTRRREGTTSVEVCGLSAEERAAALEGGLNPVEVGVGEAEPLAWVAEPATIANLHKRGVVGWRLTVIDTGVRAEVLDALARSQAAFLRTGRSRANEGLLISRASVAVLWRSGARGRSCSRQPPPHGRGSSRS